MSATSDDDSSSDNDKVVFEDLLQQTLDLMNSKPHRKEGFTEEEDKFTKSYPYCSKVKLEYHDTLSINWLINLFN